MSKIFLTDHEVAAFFGCGKTTVRRWAAEGVIPRPLKIGGLARWKLADIEAVIARAEAQREPVAA